MTVKNICCIGAGYVGGPTMAVIALKCPEIKVTVVDFNEEKIKRWNGDYNNLPVFEPGLSSIVKKTRGKNLFFSTEIDKAINESEMIFLAVNTPTKTSGKGAGMAADLSYIESCAKNISKVAKKSKIIIEKSTLPVRTAEKLKVILEKNKNVEFDILSNPEFLAEGTAIQDLFKSDRVLIGGENTKRGKNAIKKLKSIYEKWIPKSKIITTNLWSSELVKLASNAMLAQRISSINSLSALCEKTQADIDEVSEAIGMDKRIGKYFLKPSVGFGGSCFKKDILNLVYLCKYYGLNEVAEYWHQVVKINDYQRIKFAEKIINDSKFFKNNRVAILGWAFKKNTNDSRESSSIYVTKQLLDNGFKIDIYDPMVSKQRIFSDLTDLYQDQNFNKNSITSILSNIIIHSNIDKTLKNTSAVAILTEWDEFEKYDWNSIANKINKSFFIYDGRNILKKYKLNSNNINYKPLDRNGENLFKN